MTCWRKAWRRVSKTTVTWSMWPPLSRRLRLSWPPKNTCSPSWTWDLLVQWRKQKRTMPILILTARDTWEDKVVGLEAGADDYLTKPFHEAELMARLKALLRRRSGQVSQVVTLNGVSLDEAGQRVCSAGAAWRSLTATEYRLLRYLMHHPDRIHSKERLLEQLYALEQDAAAPNLVEVYVARLRRYLGKSVIQTRRGQGYIFVSR